MSNSFSHLRTVKLRYESDSNAGDPSPAFSFGLVFARSPQR
jgi:hypothetical protein